MITDLLNNIEREYRSNIDQFSQDVIIAQLELLFTYADRFYHRQFITRKIANHRILHRLEELLNEYFADEGLVEKGLPTVSYISGRLNVSPNYLSGLFKAKTSLSPQDFRRAFN